jgi:hypothetical protein
MEVVQFILIPPTIIHSLQSIVAFSLDAKLLMVEHYILKTPMYILFALALRTTRLTHMEMISMLVPLPVSTKN